MATPESEEIVSNNKLLSSLDLSSSTVDCPFSSTKFRSVVEKELMTLRMISMSPIAVAPPMATNFSDEAIILIIILMFYS